MGRRKSRLLTLVKLSPLYLLVAALLYVLIGVEKDYDYLDAGRKFYESREYDQALYYLDMAVDRKIYRGSRMLEVLLLRANTLAELKGYDHALDDLEKIIQLRPNSELAREARSLKGDILANQFKYKESLAVFEKLIEDTDEEESESLYEYQSKAAAVSYNISSVQLLAAEEVLNRNLDDPSREIESINLYTTDLQQNYSPAWLRSVLLEHLTVNTCEHVLLLAAESNRYYRYAHKILEEYPYRSAFNPMSSNFLAKIFYQSRRYLPAMIECTLALKEPLDRDRRLSFQQTMADIYQDLECFGKAAEIYETIRGPLKRPNPGLERTLRERLDRDIVFTRLRNGDFDLVISEGKILLSRYRADLVVKYCTGAAYMMKKDPFYAIPLLQDVVDVIRRGEAPQYLAESPARKECFQLLFQTHMLANSFQNALNTLDFSIQIYPDDLELRRRRALLLDERLERFPEAGRDYLFLLNHGPRDPKTFDHWIRTQEAAFMYRKGMTFHDRASQLLDQFERRERSVNRDAKRKVERFTELTLAASFPEANSEPALKLALSEAFMARGRREQGKSILRMLSRSMPDNLEFPFRLGRLYFQEGNTRVALREFETILEKDPLDFEAIKMTLDCYRDLNDLIGEGRLIQSVLNNGNPSLRVWMLARLEYERTKHEHFFKLYDTSADLPEALQTDLDLMAARCRIAENRMGAASQIVDPILEIEPENLEALIIKAHLLPAARPSGGDGEGVLPDPEDGASKAEGTEKEGADETEPLPGEEEVPIKPESPTELELLVDTVHTLGPFLCEGNLDEMCGFLIESGRPDLVLRLTTDLETVFPLSLRIIRKIARALHASGKTEEGAAYLIRDDADPTDFRWSAALAIPPVSGEHILRDIVLKTRETEVAGEFLLRAAGSAALRASLAEGARYLALASQCQDKGAFTTREAETIDALTRLLLLYASRGLNIVPEETADSPEGGAEEEEMGDEAVDEEASQAEVGDGLDEAGTIEEEGDDSTEPPLQERPKTRARFTAGADQDTQEITPPEEEEESLPP